jgi:hypothetical protein
LLDIDDIARQTYGHPHKALAAATGVRGMNVLAALAPPLSAPVIAAPDCVAKQTPDAEPGEPPRDRRAGSVPRQMA